MNAIVVIFDTLTRRHLEPYGKDAAITPNFTRLAQRAITFTNAYAGSLPCMPARRDLLTGRLGFLHAAWGPFEPFETSYTQALSQAGVYSRLVTDHYHYLEEGGGGYHTKFSTWECIRGQEGDPWKGQVRLPDISHLKGRQDIHRSQDIVNRGMGLSTQDYPIHQVFEKGIAFLEENQGADPWLLQLESFSPHEPFAFAPQFGEAYGYPFDTEIGTEWPAYEKCTQPPTEQLDTQMRYKAAVTACDHYMGKLLDAMDRLDLWKDTLLVVTTDHGFLLGEHDWWGKTVQPCYNEVAHIPFFLWDPRQAERAGTCCDLLVQWIDIAPTLLEAFGLPPMGQSTGKSLLALLTGRVPPRESALFGYFGGHVNLANGRYVYMRAADESKPLYEYTLAPYEMKKALPMETLRQAELVPGNEWSNGCPVLKLPGINWGGVDMVEYPTALFDLVADPRQLHPLSDTVAEERMLALLKKALHDCSAPAELWERLSLT